MKKLLMLLVAGTMVFAASACGKRSSDAGQTPGTAMPKEAGAVVEPAKDEAKQAVDETKKTVDEAKKVVEEKK